MQDLQRQKVRNLYHFGNLLWATSKSCPPHNRKIRILRHMPFYIDVLLYMTTVSIHWNTVFFCAIRAN